MPTAEPPSAIRRDRRVARLASLLASVLAVLVVAAVAQAEVAAQPERIVAVGDVHGSIDGLVTILGEAGVIDGSRRWSGGRTTFVQIGDMLDRGEQVREVMDLLMRLQHEAAAVGGEVICLIGNHEAMNLMGILRDVEPRAFAAFVDDRSQRRRVATYKVLVGCLRQRSRLLGLPQPELGLSARRQWLEAVPLGTVEYLEALGPGGHYGRWLRSLPVAVRRGDTLFIHGGISPAMRGLDVAAITRRVADDVHSFEHYRAVLVDAGLLLPTASVAEMASMTSKVGQAAATATGSAAETLQELTQQLAGLSQWESWYLVAEDGPLWFRGAALWDEAEHGAEMALLLDERGVRRMVVGHTVQDSGRIEARFAGRVLLVDTGMLSSHYTGGRPSALEIRGDTVTAIYTDGRQVLGEEGWQWVESGGGNAAALEPAAALSLN